MTTFYSEQCDKICYENWLNERFIELELVHKMNIIILNHFNNDVVNYASKMKFLLETRIDTNVGKSVELFFSMETYGLESIMNEANDILLIKKCEYAAQQALVEITD